LQRWGLLDRVIAMGTPAIRYFIQDMSDFPLRGEVLNVNGVNALYAPRRKYLDNMLAQAAVESGAELYEGFSVQQLLWEGDRVIGIQGRTQNGTIVTERARIVIGADGQHSTVARAVQAPTNNERPVLTWANYS
jgi:flavin-dependent dehydrogenase